MERKPAMRCHSGIETNPDHPIVKMLTEKAASMTGREFDRWMLRQCRKSLIDYWLHFIGRSKSKAGVTRALVSVFRDAYHVGHIDGFFAGAKHQRRKAKKGRKTDGR